MSYGDMDAVSKVISAIGKDISTNSPAILGAYLGQKKLKSEILIKQYDMSENTKNRLREAVDLNIRVNMDYFKKTSGKTINKNEENELYDTYNSFANLANTDDNDFRTNYAASLNNLLNDLLVPPRISSGESPYYNQVRMAKDSAQMQIMDWNNFLDNIVGWSGKENYYIAGMNGSAVDISL